MGSELSDFLALPFVSGALAIMCILGLLLVAAIVGLAVLRRRKAAQVAAASSSVTFDETGHDMPDLDALVTLPPAAPPPAPAQRSTASAAAPPPASPAPARAARKGTFSVAVKDGTESEAVEVMTVLRDVVDGRLLVQMGDRVYQNINNDAEFKERFMKLMRELGQVAGKTAAAPLTSSTAEAQTETDAAPTSLRDLLLPNEPDEKPAISAAPPRPAVSAPPPIPTTGRMPGDLPSFRLDDNPLPKAQRGRKLEQTPVPEVNIAGAIEAYLQHKLRQSVDFSGRSIHIYPAPDGGVSIEVDGQYYDAVGDITDRDVREFIAGAIQEWQERH